MIPLLNASTGGRVGKRNLTPQQRQLVTMAAQIIWAAILNQGHRNPPQFSRLKTISNSTYIKEKAKNIAAKILKK